MLDKHGMTFTYVGLPPVHHPIMEYHRLLASFDLDEMRREAKDVTA